MIFATYWGLVVAGLLTLVGCNPLRNEVNSPYWQQADPPLAITCFLSPQDVILAVKVSRTIPLMGGQNGPPVQETVTDATIRLSQGSQFVVLAYDAKQGVYQVKAQSLPILAGLTYELSVLTTTGQRATSRCVIPEPVALGHTTFDSTTSVELGRSITRYFVQAHWQDPADRSNYYQVSGMLRSVSKGGPALPPSPGRESVSPLQYDDPEEALLADSPQQSRSMRSGRAYLTSPTSDPGQAAGFGNRYKMAQVSVTLLNTSLAFYTYQQAVAKQVLAARNPFAEPVSIPTNIEGGVGCFGAYNRSTQVINLK